MLKQLARRATGYKLIDTRLVPFMLIVLLAFPLPSAQAQVIASSPECNIGLNNETARCTGWVTCSSGWLSKTTISVVATANKRCPGYVVHNNAHVYKLGNNSGIGADTQAHFGSGAGPVMKL